jgi:tRNA (guanine37-N1)-methyltransferase
MPKQSVCIKVPKVYGEKTIIQANRLDIVDKELGIQKNVEHIYVPLARQPSETELERLKEHVPKLEISTRLFAERKKPVKTLVDILGDKLSPHLLASLPHAVDFVGDIAIIEIPPELKAYESTVGDAFLEAHGKMRTVLAKTGAVSGTYRLREFNVIAGEHKTKTIHKEHGCQYYVDLAKAYFSPRLSYEHKRVASLVKDGETVVDLFAGVGPFTVLIAKTHKNIRVYAVDVNPDAIEYLRRNVRLNRVENKVHPILGNARQVVEERLAGIADRVIMNLPEKAMDFIDATCKALKPSGGIVHFYSFATANYSLENIELHFKEAVERNGRETEKILLSRNVRETAPYEWQVVLDAKIR